MPGSRIVVLCSGVCLRIPDARRCLIRWFDAPDSGRQCAREESLRRFIIAALGRVHLACLFERIDGFGNIFAVHAQSFGNIAGAHGFSRIPHPAWLSERCLPWYTLLIVINNISHLQGKCLPVKAFSGMDGENIPCPFAN